MKDLNCENYDNEKHRCIKCSFDKNINDLYYQDQEGCFLRNESKYKNCKIPKTISNECFECEDGYNLVDKKCKITTSEDSGITGSLNTDYCSKKSSKGCDRCEDGYYLDENYNCIHCHYPCTKCFNSTYCIECNKNSKVERGTCVSMNSLIRICDKMWPNNKGCVICNDKYYKTSDGKNCEEYSRSVPL